MKSCKQTTLWSEQVGQKGMRDVKRANEQNAARGDTHLRDLGASDDLQTGSSGCVF